MRSLLLPYDHEDAPNKITFNKLENASVADIIRLQIAINDKYEEKKKTTKNWSAAKWAILYPEKAKKNNLKQTHKARGKVSPDTV